MSVYVAGGGASVVVAAAAAGPWTPASLASLKGWWDFSDATKLYTDAGTTNVTTDGQSIYQCNDKSGHGKHMVQATGGARPLYKTGVINGLSIGLFDGGDDYMASALVSAVTDNFCMVIVYQETATGTASCIFYNGDAGASGYGPSNRVDPGLTGNGYLLGGVAFFNSGMVGTSNVTLFVLRRNSGSLKFYVNGGAPLLTSATAPLAPVAVTQLGRATATYETTGRIADAYFLEGDTVAEVNLLGAYLSDKWSISWSAIS